MTNNADTISLNVGSYQVYPIRTGIFGLDGGAMFGTVPKKLWEKSIPPDDQNRIPMEARALLLRDPKNNRNILIDCGNGADFVQKYGEKMGSKFAQMYNVKEDSGVAARLKKIGLGLNDITDVILTHLHFDHAGGATTWSEAQKKLVPTFPKAQYYVQKANLETAQKPNIREKASYFAANFAPLLEAGVLKVLDGPGDLLQGISVFISNGHTRGQQVVRVSGSAHSMVYCGDLIPTSSHVRLAWIMGYDLDPLLIIEEKRELLNQAASNGWYLYFEHDPFFDCATVKREGEDFGVDKRYNLSH